MAIIKRQRELPFLMSDDFVMRQVYEIVINPLQSEDMIQTTLITMK